MQEKITAPSVLLSLSSQLFKPDKTRHPCVAVALLIFHLRHAACVALNGLTPSLPDSNFFMRLLSYPEAQLALLF